MPTTKEEVVSQEEVDRLAGLARLQFSEDEKKRLAGEMSRILGYVKKLEELDTAGVEPMAHVLDVQGPLRDDEVEKRISQGEALENAPATEDGYFRTPRAVDP